MCAGTPEKRPASGGCLVAAGSAILSGHRTVRGTHLRLPREGSLFLNQGDRNLVIAASRGDVEAFAKLVRDNGSLLLVDIEVESSARKHPLKQRS
jgi:hypothetical protein